MRSGGSLSPARLAGTVQMPAARPVRRQRLPTEEPADSVWAPRSDWPPKQWRWVHRPSARIDCRISRRGEGCSRTLRSCAPLPGLYRSGSRSDPPSVVSRTGSCVSFTFWQVWFGRSMIQQCNLELRADSREWPNRSAGRRAHGGTQNPAAWKSTGFCINRRLRRFMQT